MLNTSPELNNGKFASFDLKQKSSKQRTSKEEN